MDFEKYQKLASQTAIYPENMKLIYPLLGLGGESGEVFEKVKKHFRDNKPLDKQDLTKELGDILWYLAMIAQDLDINLQDIAETNIKKLQDRMARNKLHGDGDNR